MNKEDALEDFILIGKVLRPHGRKGDLRIKYFNPDPLFILNYSRLFLLDHKRGIFRSFKVKQVLVNKENVIVALEGINDRDAAERWSQSSIYVHRDDLPPLEEGEYYYVDIIGLKVFSEEGKYVGEVVNIFPTGSNDVYEIKGPEREIMLQASNDVIKEINLKERKMIVKIPEEY